MEPAMPTRGIDVAFLHIHGRSPFIQYSKPFLARMPLVFWREEDRGGKLNADSR
ncbi:hypothetical protein LEP3755_31440 [Leptolyngbya sp. NIES-3755]|nr:hypothetical protein LEP3755_31440 [Leptolyngbya sp. NIES-3755]